MISYAEKAQILVDALPYIKRLNGKTVVIKYGGSALTNPQVKDTIINDIASRDQLYDATRSLAPDVCSVYGWDA